MGIYGLRRARSGAREDDASRSERRARKSENRRAKRWEQNIFFGPRRGGNANGPGRQFLQCAWKAYAYWGKMHDVS